MEKCELKDGKLLMMCDSLNENTETPSSGRAKGMTFWMYDNVKTGKPSRSFAGIKSKQFPNGLVFKYCPFCGENIGSHMVDGKLNQIAKTKSESK
jgi:hypothetical protein